MSDTGMQPGQDGASRRGDRGAGIVLLGLALFVAWRAWQMQVPFAYDPLGPKAFPLGLAIMLGLMSLLLIARPGTGSGLPVGATALKLLGVLAVLVLYAVLFTRLGYLASSMIAMAVLAWIFGASWIKAGITGVALAVGSYGLFVYGLHIVLPAGTWWMQ